MKIAIHGLGRMGQQIARKLAEGSHEVYAHNRTRSKIDDIKQFGVRAAYEKADIVKAFSSEQLVLWLMLPANVLEAELKQWLAIAPKGSLLIDGGNSDFRLTKVRAQKVKAGGSRLLDIGTSGGVLGYDNGFSMMVGGDKGSYAKIKAALSTLAAPNGGHGHFGPSGSGHFVKMVHNAIEYGMMESLAEGYQLLSEGPYQNLNLAKAGKVWQQASVIESTLNKLAAQALAENPRLAQIDGVVAETGETRWTLEIASQQAMDMPAIQASFDVRLQSQKGKINFATKLLAAIRNKFGGHDLNPSFPSEEQPERVRQLADHSAPGAMRNREGVPHEAERKRSRKFGGHQLNQEK